MRSRPGNLSRGDARVYNKAVKRLKTVSLPSVHAWAEQTLWGVQASLEQAPKRDALLEARRGAITLLAAVDVLLDNDIQPGSD